MPPTPRDALPPARSETTRRPESLRTDGAPRAGARGQEAPAPPRRPSHAPAAPRATLHSVAAHAPSRRARCPARPAGAPPLRRSELATRDFQPLRERPAMPPTFGTPRRDRRNRSRTRSAATAALGARAARRAREPPSPRRGRRGAPARAPLAPRAPTAYRAVPPDTRPRPPFVPLPLISARAPACDGASGLAALGATGYRRAARAPARAATPPPRLRAWRAPSPRGTAAVEHETTQAAHAPDAAEPRGRWGRHPPTRS